MEFYNPFLVLLCVNVIYLSPSAASNSKRQTSDSTGQFLACGQLATREQCTNGQIQAAANVALDCDLLDVAEQFQDSCQRNSIGEFCNPGNELVVGYSDNITEVCGSSVTTCSSECRDQIVLARNALGCCINLAQNDSSSDFYNPEPFTYALWSSCGVEPVTEECSPSTVNLGQRSGRPCTQTTFTERLASISCTRRYLEPVLEILATTPGCEFTSQNTLEQCAVNEDGQYCAIDRISFFDQYLDVSTICNGVETCEPDCIQALQSFNDTFGCCVNDFYNGSLAGTFLPRTDWLSFEFWTQCNLTTPGFCETRLSSATQTKAFGIAATTLAALLLLIVFF